MIHLQQKFTIERKALTACAIVEESPDYDGENTEIERVLQHKLCSDCPVEEAGIRWMAKVSRKREGR